MDISHLPLLLAATLVQAQAGQDPAAVVRQALAAVEADSAGAVERRWSRLLERDPADRAARLGLATLAHLTYRDTLAERLYRGLLPAAATAPDAAAGYAALGLARLAVLRERWLPADSAAALALAAARALGDPGLLGEALLVRAKVRIRTAPPDSALAIVAAAEAVLPEDDLGARASARCIAAEALEARRDPRGAVRAAREGVELATRVDDARTRAPCHFALAVGHATQFAVDSALAAYERAIADFRRARDRAGLARALWWRADYLRLFGRLGQARRGAAEAVREAEAAGSWNIAGWARTTLVRVALAVGDLRRAALEADRITRDSARHDDRQLRAVAHSVRASVALSLGDVAAARTHQEAAAAVSSAIGWAGGEMGARTGIMWVALLEGDSAGAYAAVAAGRSHAERTGLRGHDDLLSFFEGTLALRWGRLDEAERIFRARRAGRQSQGARRYVDAARLSEVLMRQGRLDEAERELLDAAQRLDAWRESLDDQRLRLLAFQQSADRADPDLGVATVIAALARGGRLASAFEIVERGRARDLSDRLARAAALDTAASGRAVPRSGAPILLDSVQRALPDDSTALLEYVTGRGDPTTLFVITRQSARAYVLAPQDSLAPRVVRFGVLLESGEDPRTLGRELGAALLAPALADLDPAVRRLIVVPDGPLHRLPFDALVLPDGRFAVERFAIASAPAAAVLARLWERRTDAPPAGLAVLADPEFAGGADQDGADAGAGGAEGFRSALADGADLPRLRGSAREARVVARYTPAALVRRRREASEAWLKRAPLTDYGVIHFATHALVDEGSVSNTALALAPAGGDDGFVGPGELAELELAAELVVLSACRTAGGMVVRGEGVQGLAAPLLAAGARAVAATWWPIGDAATVQFVDEFYGAMATGTPAGDALRLAKLAALGRGAPAREWAAFTMVGDPLALPLLRKPAPGRGSTALLAGAGVLLVLAYGLAMRRRRASERG